MAASASPRARSAGRSACGPGSRPALFVVGLVVLIVALARPQATVSLPRQEGTVILAFDVSGSMAADDLKPTRMDAAKAASLAFVERQPPGVVVGVVAFSDGGLSVQAPTSDQAAVLAAINRLAPERGTSLGQGILAVAEHDRHRRERAVDRLLHPIARPVAGAAPTLPPVAPGSHTSGRHRPADRRREHRAARPGERRPGGGGPGVRIYTVGIGSAAGTTLDVNGFKVHTQLDAGDRSSTSPTSPVARTTPPRTRRT